jgi:nucleoporin GLE1
VLNETVSIHAAKLYALWLVAQKFVEQGETQIHVHQKSAFPIAATVLLVCDRQPELLDIFLAYLIQKCPYIAPHYIPREKTSSELDYRLRIGYLQKSDGSFETEESYHDRMAGIISLYAAFIQSPHPKHPHGIVFGWQWLATLLNRPPRRVTPIILMAFLSVAGYTLWNSYNRQFAKLLLFIKSHYVQSLPEGCIGAKTRLELYIEDFEKNRRIPLPDGYLA